MCIQNKENKIETPPGGGGGGFYFNAHSIPNVI